jgi:hypothetical protein
MPTTNIPDWLASWNDWVKGMTKQTDEMGLKLKELMDVVNKQFIEATDKTIITKIAGKETCYKTTINSVTGSVTNDFPAKPAAEDEDYWKLHMKLLDEALASRQELQLKIIDTVGTTIKGLFSPVSISNIDVNQIIQALLKSK